MLRQQPVNITTNNNRVCVCGDIETELTYSFAVMLTTLLEQDLCQRP